MTPNSMPIRVLHVDDEPADLEITRILLKREAKDDFDFDFVSVLSAEDALEKLETEYFDAIVSDYKMPGMDGLEFLEAVRNDGRYDDTPFILFTGVGGPEVAKEALEKGAERYVTKRGNPSTQCNALAQAIYELALEKRKRKRKKKEKEESEEMTSLEGNEIMPLLSVNKRSRN